MYTVSYNIVHCILLTLMRKLRDKLKNTNKVSVKEARDNFSDILGLVHYANIPITIEKSGEPFAVLINPSLWENYLKYIEKRAFETIKAIHKRNKNIDPEKLERDIEQARNEVLAMQQ